MTGSRNAFSSPWIRTLITGLVRHASCFVDLGFHTKSIQPIRAASVKSAILTGIEITDLCLLVPSLAKEKGLLPAPPVRVVLAARKNVVRSTKCMRFKESQSLAFCITEKFPLSLFDWLTRIHTGTLWCCLFGDGHISRALAP
jgi:hypothetical protein